METEKFELMLDEAQANAALEKGMLYADTFVNKNCYKHPRMFQR